MKNYLDTEFQYYTNHIYNTEASGTCTLRQMLESVRKPKNIQLFEDIDKASKSGDKLLKSELKKKLVYFTPSVYTDGNGRSLDNVLFFTNLGVIDLDNLNEEAAVELKQWLFYNYGFVIASFLSPSKKGVKAIIRLPEISDLTEFRSSMYGLFSELQWCEGFDPSSKNAVLSFYSSYDPDILIREDASKMSLKGYQLNEFDAVEPSDIEVEGTPEDKLEIRRRVSLALDKITDQGHFTLRSVSLLLGGFVGAGYLSYEEAVELMDELIGDHDYLSIKAKTYKTTARKMITSGTRKPLKLEKNERTVDSRVDH